MNIFYKIIFLNWGQTNYLEGFDRQIKILENKLLNNKTNTVIFTQHNPVYTIGRKKNSIDNLLLDKVELNNRGIDLVMTNRGGDITYHGLGQSVVYPIIDLNKQKNINQYLRNLEEIIINTLKYFGLNTNRKDNKTGIWIENRKIASIGIAIKRWIAYHGFALNINNDLDPFLDIIPCGIDLKEGKMTSMKHELGKDYSIDEVNKIIRLQFIKIFT